MQSEFINRLGRVEGWTETIFTVLEVRRRDRTREQSCRAHGSERTQRIRHGGFWDSGRCMAPSEFDVKLGEAEAYASRARVPSSPWQVRHFFGTWSFR